MVHQKPLQFINNNGAFEQLMFLPVGLLPMLITFSHYLIDVLLLDMHILTNDTINGEIRIYYITLNSKINYVLHSIHSPLSYLWAHFNA